MFFQATASPTSREALLGENDIPPLLALIVITMLAGAGVGVGEGASVGVGAGVGDGAAATGRVGASGAGPMMLILPKFDTMSSWIHR